MNVALLGTHLALASGVLLTVVTLSAAVLLLGWAIVAERTSSASRRPAFVRVRTVRWSGRPCDAVGRPSAGVPSPTGSRAPPRGRARSSDVNPPGEQPSLE